MRRGRVWSRFVGAINHARPKVILACATLLGE